MWFEIRSEKTDAGWSSLVARRAHNPKVVGSNPAPATNQIQRSKILQSRMTDAGWSSLVARRAHNPKVVGSNPAPATNTSKNNKHPSGCFFVSEVCHFAGRQPGLAD